MTRSAFTKAAASVIRIGSVNQQHENKQAGGMESHTAVLLAWNITTVTRRIQVKIPLLQHDLNGITHEYVAKGAPFAVLQLPDSMRHKTKMRVRREDIPDTSALVFNLNSSELAPRKRSAPADTPRHTNKQTYLLRRGRDAK